MSDHLKRLAAPRSWPIKRKANLWTTKQRPGPHSIEESLPALIVLRDMLKVCDVSREAKRIIANREVFVDGVAIRDIKAPVGMMDVISIPAMDLYYRMALTEKGKLGVVAISKEEASWKLCMIENKTRIAEGKIQLNLHDGKNIILDANKYKTGDVVKISLPDQKIIDVFELGAGAAVLIAKGQQAGKIAVVSEYVVTKDSSENIVKFKDGSETVKRNVFVIGKDAPVIKLPEVSA